MTEIALNPFALLLHERTDPTRLDALARDLTAEEVRTPVLVAAVDDVMLVLDGAHRVSASRALGHETVPVRVVEVSPDQPVQGWVHRCEDPHRLLGMLRGYDPTCRVGPAVARIRHEGRVTEICAAEHGLAALMDAYRLVEAARGEVGYVRLTPESAALAPGLDVEWVIPTVGELVALVRAQGPLPAGVTRFAL